MTESRQPRRYMIESLIGYSQTIRENLLRIDAALPLIPLDFSPAPAKANEPKVAAPVAKHEALHDQGSSEVPPPKGILAPGGRIPIASPRTTRRSGRDQSR